MEITDVSQYLGVPVMVQLKLPIVLPRVIEKQKLQNAADRTLLQWIPTELEEAQPPSDPPPPPVFATVQMIRYAVLYAIDGVDGNCFEMRWLIAGTAPGTMTTVGTLVNMEDVAFITRVVEVGESSPLIIAKG